MSMRSGSQILSRLLDPTTDWRTGSAGITGDAVLILAANPQRRYAMLCNDSTEGAIWLAVAPASSSVVAINEGIRLNAAGNPDSRYEIGAWNLHNEAVWGIQSTAASGSTQLTVGFVEGGAT